MESCSARGYTCFFSGTERRAASLLHTSLSLFCYSFLFLLVKLLTAPSRLSISQQLTGEIFILLKGIKFDSVHQFASHSKVVHLEDHFSEEGLFGSRFSQVKFKGHGKVQSHGSVNK